MAKVKRKRTNKSNTKQEKTFGGDYLVITTSKDKADSIARKADKNTPLYVNPPKKISRVKANKFFKPTRRITPKTPRLK